MLPLLLPRSLSMLWSPARRRSSRSARSASLADCMSACLAVGWKNRTVPVSCSRAIGQISNDEAAKWAEAARSIAQGLKLAASNDGHGRGNAATGAATQPAANTRAH
jgi:hypothetical protein